MVRGRMRALNTSMAPHGYESLRSRAVRVDLSGMAYFVLAGKDARDWLQGQATNDLRNLGDRPYVDFCLTKPTGQLLAMCRAWMTESVITIATAQPHALIARAEETVILEEVILMDVEEKFGCVQGPEARTTPRALRSDRTGFWGFEMPSIEVPEIEILSREGYELATLEAGIPQFGVDTTDKTLPPELGPHFEAQHVSYTKGCYVGQEVLMRIKARGHTNKTWVGLKSNEQIKPNALVVHQGKEVGKVHRAGHSPAFGYIASATLRNEATQEGTMVEVDGVQATVVQMPFLRA